MKKGKYQFIFFSLIVFFIFSTEKASASTETFYACNGGSGSSPKTNSCLGAWDLQHLDNSENWASAYSNDGKIGPNDDVVFLDDGGIFRGSFKIHRSGLAGKPITLKAGAGENPILSGSERFTNSDWQPWYNQNGKKIYRLNLQKGSNLGYWSWYPATSNDGGNTWERPNMELLNATYNSEDDIKNNIRDKWYLGYKPKNHYYVYYRADDEIVPGIWELGFRPEVIDMESASNIILDNVDVFGPLGCSTDYGSYSPCNLNNEFWSAQTGTTGISLRENQNITLKNLEVSYGGFYGITMGSSASSKNILLDNVNIHHYAFAMHFSSQNHVQPHTQGSQGVKNVTIQNSRIWEIGSRADESGDRELIGLLAVDGAVIRNNYLGKYGHDYENEVPYNSQQIAIVQSRNILIENNYFHDSGTGHLSFGGGATTMGTKDVTIRNNVFDRRGYNFHPDAEDGHVYGIEVASAGRNYQLTMNDCDANYPTLPNCYDDYTGNVRITNNLFINGRNLETWNKGNTWSTIDVGYDKLDSLIISNNIFYKNGGVHEIFFGPYYTTPNDAIEVKNNIFFADSVSDWNNNIIQIGSAGNNWAWNDGRYPIY